MPNPIPQEKNNNKKKKKKKKKDTSFNVISRNLHQHAVVKLLKYFSFNEPFY